MKNKKSKITKRSGAAVSKREHSTAFHVLIAVLIVTVVFIIPVIIGRIVSGNPGETDPQDTSSASTTAGDTFSMSIESIAGESGFQPIDLGSSLRLIDVVSIDGTFPEGGEDEIKENMLGIVIENQADRTVEYLTLVLIIDGIEYHFSVSTLPPASSVIAYETDMQSAPPAFDDIRAMTEHLVFFPQEPSCREEQLSITVKNGNIEVTNISGEDIEQDMMVYYKSKIGGYYVGGITYRVRISGGVRAGESRLLYAPHAYPARAKIMFVNDAT